MIELKNPRRIVITFLVFAVIFFIYSDPIVAYISTLNPFLILIATTLLNPVYLIFIWALFKSYGIKGAISGFLISTASDLISLPHIYLRSGEISTQSYNLITESTFWQMMPNFLKFNITLPWAGQVNFGIFLIYVIVAVALIVVSLMIAKKRKFKEIFIKSV